MLRGPLDLAFERAALPDLEPEQVRVDSILSAVSVGSELSLYVGNVTPGACPYPLGYQSVGRVAEVGENVVGLSVGDRVVSFYGHAGSAVVAANACLKVPAHVSDPLALLAVLGEETMKGVRKLAPGVGDEALIAGAGLLGLLTLFNLTRRGVLNVDVVEPDTHRRELALHLGARRAYRPEEYRKRRYALGFDCSTSTEGFAGLLTRLAHGGAACVLSDGNWGALTLPRKFHERELRVVGSSDGEDYAGYARWLWAHAEPELAAVFEDTVTPADLPATFERLRRWPRPVSVLVRWR